MTVSYTPILFTELAVVVLKLAPYPIHHLAWIPPAAKYLVVVLLFIPSEFVPIDWRPSAQASTMSLYHLFVTFLFHCYVNVGEMIVKAVRDVRKDRSDRSSAGDKNEDLINRVLIQSFIMAVVASIYVLWALWRLVDEEMQS